MRLRVSGFSESAVMCCLLLLVAFATPILPVYTSSSSSCYWYEDFNDGSVGDWSVTTAAAGSISPTGGPPDYDMYMKSQGPSSAYAEPLEGSAPSSGSTVLKLMNYPLPYTAELWFRLNTSNNHWFDVFSNRHLFSLIDSNTAFKARERIGGVDVNTLVWNLTLNTWYKIKYWVDPPSNTFKIDVFESGTGFVVSNETHNFHSMWFNGQTYCQTFRIGDDNPSHVDYGEAFWDEIRLTFTALIPTMSAWLSRTPVVDGYINPGSWVFDPIRRVFQHIPADWKDDAAALNFTLAWGGKDHDGTLYVKNDFVNLYIGLKIEDDLWSALDNVRFNFDNDNDGVKESGDNILLGYGIGVSNDAYIRAEDLGLASDGASASTNDNGAGAMIYNAGSKEYHFETAFPLDSADDAHDFSLSANSLAGFSVTFFDQNTAIYASWPSGSWSQMITLKIAGPPQKPNPSTADLSIRKMEVTQCVQYLDNVTYADNSLPLVRSKTTVVRVYISIGPDAGPISATVYLFGMYGSKPLGELTKSLSAPATVKRSTVTHTANFWLPSSWVNNPSIWFKSFVKADSALQRETNYRNNWLTQTMLNLNRTATPTVYIVPINVGSKEAPNVPQNSVILELKNYFKNVMPTASVNFIELSWDKIGANQPKPSSLLNSRLTQLAYQYGLKDRGIDQIFGVTPFFAGESSGMSDPSWLNAGKSIASSGFWLIGGHQEAIVAHEIIHNWGPGKGWGQHIGGGGSGEDDLSWPYRSEPASTRFTIHECGFDTYLGLVVNYTTPDLMSYSVASSSSRQAGTAVTKRPQWFSPYRWTNIFNKLEVVEGLSASESPEDAGDCIMISGWISLNHTGSLDPIFRLTGEESYSEPGSYSIVLQDMMGFPIYTKSFNISFTSSDGETEDPYHFTMMIPDLPGTAQVLLMNNTDVLDTIHMTTSPPEVMILSPNGGEYWEGMQTISWTAYDPDPGGDPLTYRVQYSRDAGETWIPLSLGLTTTTHEVNASLLGGSPYALIRVVASDGFNNGYDVCNGPFTVPWKLPTAQILMPENESVFEMGEVVLLSAYGVDIDDEFLPETSYDWFSDLDGYLGNGSQITSNLSPGTHQISLQVRDSHENVAVDEVTINVVPVTDVAVVIVPSKTVVPEGGTMDFEVVVENQGYSAENVTVKAYYDDTLIDTQLVLNLTSQTSTSLTFTWNTAGLPKADYTLSANATIENYEKDRADNAYSYYPVAIALIGDITGPGGWPEGTVDQMDLAVIASTFGLTPNDTAWEPNADMTGTLYLVPDRKVDVKDLWLEGKHYGEHGS